jgi:hypothetical protein
MFKDTVIKDANYRKGTARHLSKENIIGAFDMPALLDLLTEMKVMVVHAVEQKVLFGPLVLGRGILSGSARSNPAIMRQERQVRVEILAPFDFLQ